MCHSVACWYAYASANTLPSAKCGLPEVNLGLLPGGGGTQRLPRIVGAQKALELMTSGAHVPAQQCLEMSLLDELVPEADKVGGAVAFARKVVSENRPLKKVRDLNEKVAGQSGFVRVDAAGQLILGDGRPARFWVLRQRN